MYYSETNPLKRVKYKQREDIPVAKGERQRRLHKALLRYHDPANWPLIREALINMGKKHLIGDKPTCLVPAEDIDAQTQRNVVSLAVTVQTALQPSTPKPTRFRWPLEQTL